MRRSFDRLDIAWLPGLVERGLGRAVETEDREIALAGQTCVAR
jgi:hypothetical protein